MNNQTSDRRQAERVALDIPAMLLSGEVELPVQLTDLSEAGAQVAFDPASIAPEHHNIDGLRIWDERLGARVAWSLYQGAMGLTFARDPETQTKVAALLSD